MSDRPRHRSRRRRRTKEEREHAAQRWPAALAAREQFNQQLAELIQVAGAPALDESIVIAEHQEYQRRRERDEAQKKKRADVARLRWDLRHEEERDRRRQDEIAAQRSCDELDESLSFLTEQQDSTIPETKAKGANELPQVSIVAETDPRPRRSRARPKTKQEREEAARRWHSGLDARQQIHKPTDEMRVAEAQASKASPVRARAPRHGGTGAEEARKKIITDAAGRRFEQKREHERDRREEENRAKQRSLDELQYRPSALQPAGTSADAEVDTPPQQFGFFNGMSVIPNWGSAETSGGETGVSEKEIDPPTTPPENATEISETQQAFLNAFRQAGTILGAAKSIGIDRRMHYDWLANDVGGVYAKAFWATQAQWGSSLYKTFVNRALDGLQRKVWYRGRMVGEVTTYSERQLVRLAQRVCVQYAVKRRPVREPPVRVVAERYDVHTGAVVTQARSNPTEPVYDGAWDEGRLTLKSEAEPRILWERTDPRTGKVVSCSWGSEDPFANRPAEDPFSDEYWSTRMKKKAFLHAVRQGQSVSRAAALVGMNRWMHYHWLKPINDPEGEYCTAYEDARQAFATRVHLEIVRRVFVGIQQPVYRSGKIVGQRLEKSDRLLELMLKAFCPEFAD
jgi:hypothetical protein